jgi:hypothetical protein
MEKALPPFKLNQLLFDKVRTLNMLRSNKLLTQKTAAQYQNNYRAFVTMNGYFPSKAIKIPSFSWRRNDRFSAQSGKD